MSNSKLFTVLLLVAGALSSCKMQEQIAQEKRYFSNTKDSVLYQTINRQPVIQKGDMLSIMVWVRNEVYRREFNSFNGTATMSPSESGTQPLHRWAIWLTTMVPSSFPIWAV